MNKISLIGNLGRDPEVKQSTRGDYVTLSLAVSLKKEETQWFRCLIWPDRMPAFEKMLKWIKKGSMVWVDGRLEKPTIYQSKNGDNGISLSVTVTDINFVPGNTKSDANKRQDMEISQGQGKSAFEEETDLPF